MDVTPAFDMTDQFDSNLVKLITTLKQARAWQTFANRITVTMRVTPLDEILCRKRIKCRTSQSRFGTEVVAKQP